MTDLLPISPGPRDLAVLGYPALQPIPPTAGHASSGVLPGSGLDRHLEEFALADDPGKLLILKRITQRIFQNPLEATLFSLAWLKSLYREAGVPALQKEALQAIGQIAQRASIELSLSAQDFLADVAAESKELSVVMVAQNMLVATSSLRPHTIGAVNLDKMLTLLSPATNAEVLNLAWHFICLTFEAHRTLVTPERVKIILASFESPGAMRGRNPLLIFLMQNHLASCRQPVFEWVNRMLISKIPEWVRDAGLAVARLSGHLKNDEVEALRESLQKAADCADDPTLAVIARAHITLCREMAPQPEVFERLKGWLDHNNPKVAMAAAEALGWVLRKADYAAHFEEIWAKLRLHTLDIHDRGDAADTVAAFMSSYYAKTAPHVGHLSPEHVRYALQTTTIDTFLRSRRVSGDPVAFNRTDVYHLPDESCDLALKFYPKECLPEEVAREARVWHLLQSQGLALKSEMPQPVENEKGHPLVLSLPDGRLALPLRVPKNYYTYLNDPGVGEADFFEGLYRSVHDIFYLARYGLYHTVPAALFHGDPATSSHVAAGGHYLFSPYLVGSLDYRGGAGSLEDVAASLAHANLGVSGVRDGEEFAAWSEILKNPQHWCPGTARSKRPNSRQLLEPLILGKTLFSVMLLMGERLAKNLEEISTRDVVQGKDGGLTKIYAAQLAMLLAAARSARLGESEDAALDFVTRHVDLKSTMLQLVFYMSRRYVPYLAPGQAVGDLPEGLYDSAVIVSSDHADKNLFGGYRLHTWDSETGFVYHGKSKVGAVNGPLPVDIQKAIWSVFVKPPATISAPAPKVVTAPEMSWAGRIASLCPWLLDPGLQEALHRVSALAPYYSALMAMSGLDLISTASSTPTPVSASHHWHHPMVAGVLAAAVSAGNNFPKASPNRPRDLKALIDHYYFPAPADMARLRKKRETVVNPEDVYSVANDHLKVLETAPHLFEPQDHHWLLQQLQNLRWQGIVTSYTKLVVVGAPFPPEAGPKIAFGLMSGEDHLAIECAYFLGELGSLQPHHAGPWLTDVLGRSLEKASVPLANAILHAFKRIALSNPASLEGQMTQVLQTYRASGKHPQHDRLVQKILDISCRETKPIDLNRDDPLSYFENVLAQTPMTASSRRRWQQLIDEAKKNRDPKAAYADLWMQEQLRLFAEDYPHAVTLRELRPGEVDFPVLKKLWSLKHGRTLPPFFAVRIETEFLPVILANFFGKTFEIISRPLEPLAASKVNLERGFSLFMPPSFTELACRTHFLSPGFQFDYSPRPASEGDWVMKPQIGVHPATLGFGESRFIDQAERPMVPAYFEMLHDAYHALNRRPIPVKYFEAAAIISDRISRFEGMLGRFIEPGVLKLFKKLFGDLENMAELLFLEEDAVFNRLWVPVQSWFVTNWPESMSLQSRLHHVYRCHYYYNYNSEHSEGYVSDLRKNWTPHHFEDGLSLQLASLANLRRYELFVSVLKDLLRPESHAVVRRFSKYLGDLRGKIHAESANPRHQKKIMPAESTVALKGGFKPPGFVRPNLSVAQYRHYFGGIKPWTTGVTGMRTLSLKATFHLSHR